MDVSTSQIHLPFLNNLVMIKGCMDLGCLDFFLSVTLVTNTALLGIMMGVVTNMMDCD